MFHRFHYLVFTVICMHMQGLNNHSSGFMFILKVITINYDSAIISRDAAMFTTLPCEHHYLL